jgi:hypothetical protein
MIWGIMAQELFALGHGNNRRRIGSSLRQGSPRWSGGQVGTRILTPRAPLLLSDTNPAPDNRNQPGSLLYEEPIR